ncbi:MAG TPA: hypothetical protein DCZ59_10030, partial [Bacteroidetes bacterium]|nr:hypothetical protein [Bacteroidota bacterium]
MHARPLSYACSPRTAPLRPHSVRTPMAAFASTALRRVSIVSTCSAIGMPMARMTTAMYARSRSESHGGRFLPRSASVHAGLWRTFRSLHEHNLRMIIVDEQLPIVSRVLGQITDVICVAGDAIDRSLLQRTGATALFIRTVTHVSSDLIAGTDVRFIASASAGIDHVEDDVRNGTDVLVVHAPGCNAQAVSEYVMTWLRHFDLPRGTTLGVVGFGHVGSLLSRLACASGMHVLVNDPPLAGIGHAFPSPVTHVDLDELLHASDVVSLHVPYTEAGLHATRGLIGATRLAMLKNGATIINSSRGGIVDETALADHVSSGRLHAVLDVYENEPDVSRQVIEAIRYCTPHIAGYSQQAK